MKARATASWPRHWLSTRHATPNWAATANRHRLFHSVTIASKREAAYLFDGLFRNDVVKFTIYSTDTHGFTEVNFTVTYLTRLALPRVFNPFRASNCMPLLGWPCRT